MVEQPKRVLRTPHRGVISELMPPTSPKQHHALSSAAAFAEAELSNGDAGLRAEPGRAARVEAPLLAARVPSSPTFGDM